MNTNRELSPIPARAAAAHDPLLLPKQPEADESSNEGVIAYWRIIVRHRWTVVLIALAGLLTGAVLTLPQTPVYQAHTSLEVQGLNENFLNLKDLTPTSAPGGYVDPSYEISTQAKILQSRSLLDQVVRRLVADKDLQPAVPPTRLDLWRKVLHLGQPHELNRESVIGAAAGGISVKASGNTRIVEITCDSIDPKLAATFANTLVDEFIDKNLEDRWKSTERTGQWLTKQLDDLKIKLEQSEAAMQSYAAATGLQFTGGDSGKDGEQQNVADANVKLLQDELLKARAERMTAQSKYNLVASSPADALPQVLDDPALRDYQNKLTELRRQRAELSTTLTPANDKVRRVQAQIDELESTLVAERSNVVTRLGNDYKAAEQHEKLVDDEFGRQLKTVSSQAATEMHYNILKREMDTNRQLYESLLEKVKESAIASEMRANNFRIIDAALPPGAPYKPSLTNNGLLGLMGGVFLGFVFVLVREQADRSIQQPGDSSLYLGLAELGVIPSERPVMLRSAHTSKTVTLEMTEAEAKIELVTWQRQRSLLAECFRTVLTSIMFSEQDGHRPRIFVVASPNPAEGKTTVASNLAIALAEINQKVLLIDADMRRPRLHKLYGLKNDNGFGDLLKDKQPFQPAKLMAAIRETWISGLHVLPSGPHAANTSTLLYSARLPEVIDAVRHSFDAVVIDSPPMLHIADSRLLARHADSVLLILRAGKTTRAAAVEAKQKFAADGANILGTILTDWNPDQNGYGYNYKYYATHSAYYTNHGLTNGSNGSGPKSVAGD